MVVDQAVGAAATATLEREPGLLLECRGIDKAFGAVRALKGVDFDLRPGEVHALLGQNGAGKSTLIKVLAGAEQRDGGEIRVGGEPVNFRTPADSRDAGVSIVYQELSLVPSMSIAANLFLGREPHNRFGKVDQREIRGEAKRLLEAYEIPLDPRTRVGDLPFAYRQLIEIVGALSGDVRILVLDEPTSSLTANEEELLFNAVGQVTARGVGVVYVTHRMSEVFRLSDRVTVLRDGGNVATFDTSATDLPSLVSAIVGSAQEELREAVVFGLGPQGEQASSPAVLQLSQTEAGRVRAGGFSLGVILHTDSDWSRQQVRGISDTAQAYGIKVLDVVDADFQVEAQIAAIDAMIERHPDVIISIPVNAAATAEAYGRIGRAGIKLVLMDNAPLGLVAGRDYVSLVSTDNYSSGAVAASLLAPEIGTDGSVGILGFDADFFSTTQREIGFEKWFRDERPDVTLQRTGFTDPSGAGAAAREFLDQQPELDGLFVVWDEPALAVHRAVREAGRTIPITTVDLGNEIAAVLRGDDLVKGLAAQRPYELGVAEVLAAANALIDKEPPAWVALPPLPVTPGNVAEAFQQVWNPAATVRPVDTPAVVTQGRPAPAATAPAVVELVDVGNDRLQGVSLALQPGEIVGLAGLIGSGRTEILETIFGLRRVERGELRLRGDRVTLRNPAEAIRRGVALAPEDRHNLGLVLEHTIERNVAIPRLPQLSRSGLFRRQASRDRAQAAMSELSVKAPSPATRLDQLSGGNQQKVVFGKWRDPDPVLLLLDEPTAGVDVGARDEIYGVIRRIAQEGAAVLVASGELAELLLLCDRIAIVSHGRIAQQVLRAEVENEDHLNHLVQEADR